MTIVDSDNVAESNVNRQLIATTSTVGRPKVELFADRFRDINPEINVNPKIEFVDAEKIEDLFCNGGYDYVVDAIDTVAPKVALIAHCLRHRIPIVSSMGAGGRIDVTKVGYYDLWETREDGLARAVRQKTEGHVATQAA